MVSPRNYRSSKNDKTKSLKYGAPTSGFPPTILQILLIYQAGKELYIQMHAKLKTYYKGNWHHCFGRTTIKDLLINTRNNFSLFKRHASSLYSPFICKKDDTKIY